MVCAPEKLLSSTAVLVVYEPESLAGRGGTSTDSPNEFAVAAVVMVVNWASECTSWRRKDWIRVFFLG